MPTVHVGAERGHGIDMFYELHGQGDTKILFIMGFLTTHHAWSPQINFFSKFSTEFQICVFDNRGCGETTVSYGGYSSTQMALDAVELCNHLKWDKFHIVAISMGGMIGIELALHNLHRVQSLSLAVTHCGGISSFAPVIGVWKMMNSIVNIDLHKRARVVQSMLYSQEFLAKQLNTETNETMLDKLAKEWAIIHTRKPSPFGFMGHLKTVLTHSVSFTRLHKLKEANIPILILTGTVDDLVPPINSHTLHKFLEVSELVVFEGAGHCINLECEEKFNEAILSNIYKGIHNVQ